MDDVVIIGGGIIGATSAYFLSKEGRKVKVIERDPTYKKASFPLSLGGFRRQFFQKENILLGKFAREFIFKIPELLKTEKNPKPTASVVPNGYLFLFGSEHAPEQYEALKNHKACEAGTKNIKGSELKKIFPYVNDEGIETVTYTDNQLEGWIDPHMFHSAIKNKAIELGTKFIKGEINDISEVKAKVVISAVGYSTNVLLKDIPVVPQKHTVFRVSCPKHIPEMPLTSDFTTGVYWRPEGKEYLAGSPISKFDAKDLEPEWNDFEEFVLIQSETAVRKLASAYPYDTFDDDEADISLRSGLEDINHELDTEMQERLNIAGIEVIEGRINHLAYASEIAGAMLQRQQATAIVAARLKIVEGAVGMVEMALEQLSKKEILELDEEKRAAMVSNLMVVLCGDKNAQPVVNTGTLYT